MKTVQTQNSRATILIVDDDVRIRRIVRDWLEGEGYHVREAEDGNTAVEMAQRERPDLILMDMNMPQGNGLAATKLIRSTEGLAEVPIVALTGNEHPDLHRIALAAGCSEFVAKPVNFQTLVRLIDRFLHDE